MRHKDQQLGYPETVFKGTKSQIPAISNSPSGVVAYATDTDEWEFSYYVSGNILWRWHR